VGAGGAGSLVVAGRSQSPNPRGPRSPSPSPSPIRVGLRSPSPSQSPIRDGLRSPSPNQSPTQNWTSKSKSKQIGLRAFPWLLFPRSLLFVSLLVCAFCVSFSSCLSLIQVTSGCAAPLCCGCPTAVPCVARRALRAAARFVISSSVRVLALSTRTHAPPPAGAGRTVGSGEPRKTERSRRPLGRRAWAARQRATGPLAASPRRPPSTQASGGRWGRPAPRPRGRFARGENCGRAKIARTRCIGALAISPTPPQEPQLP
jgi:hypothetical protein